MQHFFPDWEMLRSLDARIIPLLATDPLSSDWPGAPLSTAVNYYKFIIFRLLMIYCRRTTRAHCLFFLCVAPALDLTIYAFSYALIFLLVPYAPFSALPLASTHLSSANHYCLCMVQGAFAFAYRYQTSHVPTYEKDIAHTSLLLER